MARVIEPLQITDKTLESTMVHWLRHTGISEDVKMRPREKPINSLPMQRTQLNETV